MPGTLYLVATPIGNLKDISIRATEILRTADLIACEDTRHTRKLLNHLGITNKLISYHQHNESARANQLAERMLGGDSVALVSDAGTPGVSDPGYRLVQAAIEQGITVIPIPGPAAFVNAVIASGLPTSSIYFGGFLPSKRSERVKRLREVAGIPATLVFYEAPHRLSGSLADCLAELGPRPAAIVRELTKIHEEIVRGGLDELTTHFSKNAPRGEIVLVIDGPSETAVPVHTSLSLPERLRQLEAGGLDHKTALKTAAKEFGLSKPEAYRIVQAQKNT